MSPIRFFETTSFRLALLYAGLFTASALMLFGLTYWALVTYAAKQQEAFVEGEAAAIRDEARRHGFADLARIVEEHVAAHRAQRVAYLLEAADGSFVAGNIPPRKPQVGRLELEVALAPDRDEHAHRGTGLGYFLGNGQYLLVAQDGFSLHELKEFLARTFGFGTVVTLLLALGCGWLLSANVRRRVEQVNRASAAIMRGDLRKRIPIRGVDDEFDHLASQVNQMLDQIEDLMGQMRRMSSDIAHDLRTPLTRLRQRLEHTLRQPADERQYAEVLQRSVNDVSAILATFDALLRIRRIEAGLRRSRFRSVDVSALLCSIAEDFAPAAEDCGQTLISSASPGLYVRGDRELLRQMIVNVIDNSIRHAGRGAQVTAQAAANGRSIELVVSDTGPGIPAEERERVFEPFYRLEPSRGSEGAGLGLSLVAAVARLHDAHIELGDNGPGLRTRIRLDRNLDEAADDEEERRERLSDDGVAAVSRPSRRGSGSVEALR